MKFSKNSSQRIFLAALAASAIFVSYALIASALSEEDIVFPVVELGNCKDKTSCKNYCEDPSHIEACVRFAEKYNLISSQEADRAEKFVEAGSVGPGGCSSADECETYCDDIAHMDECLDFAEKTGLIGKEELEEGRKVQAALKAGAALPGGCRNKDECEAYCQSPDHMEECILFAEAAGFIPPDELEEARKVLAAIKAGAEPPPCRGKKECDVYCAEPDNFETCITFAEAAGLIPEEELEDAKKMLAAIKKGVKPPPCRGKEECDEYCQEPANFDACLAFAEAAGFIAPEEAEMARKTGGKGPGDCKGREECEQFCQNPDNQEICFNFAKEHGLLSEEDLQNIEEGKKRILESFDSAPPEVRACLESALGPDTIEGIRSGAVMPREDIGNSMRSCFEQFMPKPEGFGPPPGFEEGAAPPEGMMPPEGITVPEEFRSSPEMQKEFEERYQQEFQRRYQEEYQRRVEEEMQNKQLPEGFQPPEGFQIPQQMMPPAESQPPQEITPEPTSRANPLYLFAAILSPLVRLLGF